MAQIDLKNATIKIKDGTSPTPLQLTLKIGEGNLTWTEKQPRKYVKDRGVLDTVVDDDQEGVDLRFDLIWEFLRASSGSGTPTPHDALKKRGEASAFVSTDSDACAPYAVDIEVTHVPPCAGVQTETVLFSDFRFETLEQDLRNGTLSVSGMCNITEPTVTRS